MSVGVIVNIRVKPGGAEPWKAAFGHGIPETRTQDGCEDIYLGVDDDNPNHLILVQKWASKEHYVKYADWRGAQPPPPGMAEMMALLDGEMETVFLADTGA